MRQSLKLAAITLGVLTVPISWGCPAPTRPNADSTYKTIVLAEVVGVHLTDYTAARLDQMKEGRAYAWPSDASPGYDVDLIAFETFAGSADKTLSLHVAAGCAVPTPELNQFGIFYVNEDGTAQVVFQNHRDYRDRLEKLGSRYTGLCETTLERFSPHPCWKPTQAQLQCVTHIKDIAYSTRSSCPAGVQELYERLKEHTVVPYGWQWPPLRSIQ